MKTSCILLVALGLLALVAVPVQSQTAPSSGQMISAQGDDWDGPLPRWREGGSPPDDPNQSLHPYAVDLTAAPGWADAPTSGYMASPPEYAPCDGVIFRWGGGWTSVVNQCVMELTADPAFDETAWVVVTSAAQQTSAEAAFLSVGADLSKVEFVIEPSDSIWLRDYGPHFVWQSGAMAIADSHYYPTRPKDNFLPTLLADDAFKVPPYAMPLYYSGGNFQPGPDRSGFVTSLVNQDNPSLASGDIEALYQGFQGIDTLHIMPKLPGSVDGTGHIDMWLYLVDEDTVIISEFKPGSNATAITITENAVLYMEALGFEVFRVPAWNAGSTHYTYTNAYRVNDRIFVPIYGPGDPNYADEDADAVLAWRQAAGGAVEIVTINCYSIIPAAGAIHCIVMQVPRYTAPDPAAHVVSMDGGEIVCAGTLQDLRWTACDDEAVTAIDVKLSVDGGNNYDYPVVQGAPNNGRLTWLVPDVFTQVAKLKVTAYDDDAHSTPAVSETALEIIQAPLSVYDFSTGAGSDRWAWGSSSNSWAALAGQRYPASVGTELTTAQYAKLAASDATGGDSDTNRYVSPSPSGNVESTHVFDFVLAEDVSLMRDVAITWEGYGDQCLQMELYVWDLVAGDWGDGNGNVGENLQAANWAGNRDEPLTAHLQGDLTRYVDGAGHLTFMLYAERGGQETFHDYVSVSVAWDASPWGLWTHDFQPLAGEFGAPQMAGSGGLLGNDEVVVRTVNAPAGLPAGVILGASLLNLPFKGGVMVPAVDILLDGLVTDGSGRLELVTTWPTGLPSALPLYMQTWFADPAGPHGFTATNAVTATTP
jgi:agmatine/peptidylarginine deiminase